jgi:hypothetical protein
MQRPKGLTTAEFANSARWSPGRQEAGSPQYHLDEGSLRRNRVFDNADLIVLHVVGGARIAQPIESDGPD